MREIKFRGKNLNTKEWVYGDLLQWNDGETAIGVHGQFIDDGYHFNENYDKTPYVDETTVGQYTGLKDKSGKEIYEGDIINVNGKYPKLIRYIDEWASYCLANLTDLDCDLKTRYWHQVSPCWWTDYKREIKVIGNVYDNPELLKGGEKNESNNY
jgi:uncharacterized phage protein (TIGR01671 family)